MTDTGEVRTETANCVAKVTFSHPKGNSLPGQLLRSLANTFTSLSSDDQVRVILLTSNGEKAFCAGASFDELIAIEDERAGLEFFSGFAHVINAMRKCPKPIVCRAQGKVVGGGVGLVSASDYALAHSSASVKLSELALGIGPFVVGPAVERKIGTARFSALAFDADWKNAAWAKEAGLYVEVYQSHAELETAIDAIVNRLAGFSPEALAELKSVTWTGTEDWDQLLIDRAQISGRLVLSDFTKNYIREFKASTK